MTHDRQAQRSAARTAQAAAQIAFHVVAPWKRPWRVSWGARPEERDAVLPGDELLDRPTWGYTHAVSVAAEPDEVWPWIAQLGQGRAGFYSFERLENLVGCRITNADAVLADLQHPAPGDVIRIHPKAPPLHVALVDPPRSLVLRGSPPGAPPAATDNLWSFHVLPAGPGRCRLIERGRTIHTRSVADRLFLSTLITEPIGFVMGREMLLGIKERAERRATG